MRTIAQNDQITAAARERQGKWQRMVDTIKAKQKTLLEQRQTISDKRAELLAGVNDLDDNVDQLPTWESYFTKDARDPELVKLHSDLGRSQHEQSKTKSRLPELLAARTDQRVELERVYDGLVKWTAIDQRHSYDDRHESHLPVCTRLRCRPR
jgi:chromosome segregation ATPase